LNPAGSPGRLDRLLTAIVFCLGCWLLASQSMTRQMLSVQKGASGLGLGLDGSGKTLRFSHGERDEGFDAFMMAYAESGQGVVIMINANDNSGTVNRMVDVVRREDHWSDSE